MANLEIKVGADIRGAIAALKQFGTEIDRAGGVTEATANKMASALNKALNTAQNLSRTNIGNLDFADKFEQARQKINANIDAMVNDALGIKNGFQQTTAPAIRSIQELETEISELKQRIVETNDIGIGQKLSIQLGALEREAEKLKSTFRGLSNLKIVAPFGNIIPPNLTSAVAAFGGGVKKVSTDLILLGKTSAATTANVSNVTTKLNQLPRASNTATTALINLGRVAQDAPFGIIGIANNINPLLESFQRLQKEAGSTSVAMKSLFASFLGGGGIGLAVSVITSALTFFALKNQGAQKEVDSTNKILEANRKKAEEAAAEERKLAEAINTATSQVIQQADKLKDLKEALTSTTGEVKNLTDATVKQGVAQFIFNSKNEAVQKLLNAQVQQFLRLRQGVSQAPEITFKGDERSLDPLTKRIATAKDDIRKLNELSGGLEDLIKNIFDKQFDGRSRGDKSKFEFLYDFLPFDPSGKLKPEQRSELLSAIDKFQKEFTGIFKGVNFSLAGTQDEKIKLALKFDADLKLGKVQFDTKAFADAIDKTLKPEELVPKDSLSELPKLVVDQFIKGFQSESERLKNLNPLNISPTFNINTDLNAQLDLFKTNLRRIGAQIPQTIQATNIFGDPVEVTFEDLFDTSKISNSEAIEALRKAFGQIKNEIANFKAEIESAFTNFQVNALSGIGESLGQAIASGDNVFKIAARSFTSTLGDFIELIGKNLIKFGIVKLGLDKALASLMTLPGGALIAFGVTTVAIGAAVKASFANLKPKGFAKGGWVGGSGNGDTVPAMLTPGEFVVTKDKAPFIAALLKLLGGGINSIKNFKLPLHFAQGGFVPTVRNTDVQSPLGNLQKALSGLAFSQSTTVIPDVKIKGSDLVLVFNRTNQSQFRNFGR